MARSTGPRCRQCRRYGIKLFLKGDRCFTDKCALERRAYAPGQHGQMRRKLSEYGIQLKEKQCAKLMYGILERQFRRHFTSADRMRGVTGDNLLIILERRLDNLVFRMGFARSRSQARQFIRHGHFLVNNRKVNIPSYLVSQGDSITVAEKSRKLSAITEAMEAVERRGIPEWLMFEKDAFRGKLMAHPSREQLTVPINEQLIVELYSK